jgi:hypothetical protein
MELEALGDTEDFFQGFGWVETWDEEGVPDSETLPVYLVSDRLNPHLRLAVLHDPC